jgi:hypothetical protein
VRAARGACWQARHTGGVPGPAALAQDELVVKAQVEEAQVEEAQVEEAQVEEAQVEEMDHPGPSVLRSGAVTLPLE